MAGNGTLAPPAPALEAKTMAHLLQAIRRYGPSLVYNQTADTRAFADWMAGRTGLTRGQVRLMLSELSEGLIRFARAGTPVSLEGLGRFRPVIGLDGEIRLRLMPDRSLDRAVGSPSDYAGEILNRGNVGLSPTELKALWDAEFPEDPLELPEEQAA